MEDKSPPPKSACRMKSSALYVQAELLSTALTVLHNGHPGSHSDAAVAAATSAAPCPLMCRLRTSSNAAAVYTVAISASVSVHENAIFIQRAKSI